MFLVVLTYIQPLEAVDAHLGAHRDYLRRCYDAGVFLLSGPRVPREGGVILAQAESLSALEAILAEDPFQIHGLARYDIVAFTPGMAAPALTSLLPH